MKVLLLAPCSPLWCEITLTLADRLNTRIELEMASFLSFANVLFLCPVSDRMIMKICCCLLIGKQQTDMLLPPKGDVCFHRKCFRTQRVCRMSEWSVDISEQMSAGHVPVQRLQRSSVILLSFPAVSASLNGRSVTLVLCFTPGYFGEPSAAALLGRPLTSRDFRLHKFSQRKAQGLM